MSVVGYRNYRWMWLTIIGLVVCAVVYFANTPVGGRNGGTTVGYTLGVVATLGIIWLMGYGVRKRAYHSQLGTVQGWLAAHVWIGIGLTFLVPLHAGLHFGWNVHTLAYVLMVLTIVTGIWGMVNYANLSEKLESHRGGYQERAALEQIKELSEQIESLAQEKSDAFMLLVRRFDFMFAPRFSLLLGTNHIPRMSVVMAGNMVSTMGDDERRDALKAIELIDRKADLARGIVRESRIKALLRVWLYTHVPISCGLCAALAIHIVSVFFFR